MPGAGILLGAAGAAGGGAVLGFVLAILVLQAKGWRNARLMARGEPGYKDCVLQLVFVPLLAIAGAIAGAVAGVFLAAWPATLVGALVPAGLLAVLVLGNTVWQAFR